jgi:thioredoxin-dependent peroxiredoxin
MDEKEFKPKIKIWIAAIVGFCTTLIILLFLSGCPNKEKAAGISKEKEMVKLKIGDTAPAFELLEQNSKMVKLSDFAGKKVLVYFYPKADTPGCTKQACSVRDSAEPLKNAGVVALGISPDKPEAQKKFDEKYKLGFRLLSDSDHKTAEAYGVWGKSIFGITRSSFLVDEQGKIIGVWYGVNPSDTVPKAMETLGK